MDKILSLSPDQASIERVVLIHGESECHACLPNEHFLWTELGVILKFWRSSLSVCIASMNWWENSNLHVLLNVMFLKDARVLSRKMRNSFTIIPAYFTLF
jgi:hypothetical protein